MRKRERNGPTTRRPVRKPSHPPSLWESIVRLDKQYTHRWGVCASKDAAWGALRPLMKVLEISGHGLPWFGFSVPLLCRAYVTRDSALFNPTANLILGLLLDLLVSFVLKGAVRRPRPAANKNDMLMTVSVDAYSFPSGHCTRVAFVLFFFTTSFALSQVQSMLLLFWTVTVCVSRVLLGRHYWGDVVCGAMIGLAQGSVIRRYWMMWDLTDFGT